MVLRTNLLFLLIFLCQPLLGAHAFLDKSPFPTSTISWNSESLAAVQFAETATVQLSGKISEGNVLELNSSRVTVDPEGRFDFAIELPEKPERFRFTLHDEEGATLSATLTYRWKKQPPLLKLKVKEGKASEAKVVQFTGSDPTDEWLEFNWTDVKRTDPVGPKRTPWHNHLQLSSLAIMPTTGGNSISPELFWLPHFTFGKSLSLRAGLGITIIKYDSEKSFAVGEVGVSVFQPIGPVHIGVGPLLQHWMEYGGARFCGSATVLRPLMSPWLGFVESIVLGYNLCFPTDAKVHQASLGVGITL